MRTLLLLTLIFGLISVAHAEVIYLKDGQVIEGKIMSETVEFLVIKTEFQTRKIWRNNIKRIMLSERKMEHIYLLLNNGDKLEGYLVDQDANKVYFKDSPDSPVEKSIAKNQIKQMSAKEIIPLEFGISPRLAYFMPFKSGGADLQAAMGYLLGVDMNLSLITNSRLNFETGYIRSDSGSNDNQFMQFYPFILSGLYSIRVSVIEIFPKVGIGVTLLNFNDGEGKKIQSFAYTGTGGVMVQYAIIKKHLFVQLSGEYRMLMESGTLLHSVLLSGGFSYRF